MLKGTEKSHNKTPDQWVLWEEQAEVPLSLAASLLMKCFLYAEISFKHLWRLQWAKMGNYH